MPANRFTLRGPDLDELKTQVAGEYGRDARIVSADKVTQGGIGGFLAKQFYEVEVEVPEGAALPGGSTMYVARESDANTSGETSRVPESRAIPMPPAPNRVGIAALLADADAAEDVNPLAAPIPRPVQPPQAPQLSTTNPDFEAVMAEITSRAGIEPGAGPRRRTSTWPPEPVAPPVPDAETLAALGVSYPEAAVSGDDGSAASAGRFYIRLGEIPSPPRAPGDLVLIVGLGQEPLAIARSMSKQGRNADIRSGGSIILRLSDPIMDRRTAQAARAEALRRGSAVFVAFGIDPDTLFTDAVRSISADQVWAVVDASRKQEDTEEWVNALRNAAGVDALAVIRAEETASPQTVNDLGVPVGWITDRPSTSTRV